MKKSKTAALLAATLLIYGGAFSVQADYGADAGENLDETGKTYSDGVYADAGGTFIIHDGVVNGSNGKMTAQGGTLTLNNSTSSIGAWASEVNGSAGTINLNGSQTTGSDIVAQGYGAAVNVTGGTVDVDHIIVRQDTVIDESSDAGLDEKTNLDELGSAVTVNSAGNVTTGDLAVEDNGSVTVGNGSQLTVKQGASITNQSELAVSDSTAELQQGATITDSEIHVSDNGSLTANGTVSMNGSNLFITNNGSVTFNNWTATGGETTIGNRETGASVLAEGNAMTVTDKATLNGHKLVVAAGESAEYGVIEANKDSDVTVENGTLTMGTGTWNDSKLNLKQGNVKITTSADFLAGSEVTTDAETTFESGAVEVNGSTFTAKGTVNTNNFVVDNGSKVELNGGTLHGTPGTDISDGSSALWIKDSGSTVTANNVTFEGGEVAVDGGTLHLTNGEVKVPNGYFTVNGGTVTTNGTAISSGIWANRSNGKGSTVMITGGTILTGDDSTDDFPTTIAAQGAGSSITIQDVENANIGAIWATHNILVDDKLVNDPTNIGGATVTLDNSTVTTGGLKVEGSTLNVQNDSALTMTGRIDFSEDSTLNVDENSQFIIGNETSHAIAAFAAGSEVYLGNNAQSRILVNNGTLTFEKGSSIWTYAKETGDKAAIVNTIAEARANGAITVNDGAMLYVKDAKTDGTTYDFSNIIKNADGSYQENAADKMELYGDSKREQFNSETGTFDAKSIAESYAGVWAGEVFDAAEEAGNEAVATFGQNISDAYGGAENEDAMVAQAYNSAAGLTGLAGVGYGTYRFTTAFTDHVANHEASDLWASYLHDKSSVDGLSVGNLRADYDLTYDGAVIGSDFYDNGRTTIGAAFAYADGDVSTKSGISTKNDVDYYGGMIYGSVKGGAGMTYRAEIGYNRSSNDLTQWNTGERITGSVDADAFHVGVAAEKEIRTGSSVWTPFLGLQYIDLSIDDYSDSLGLRHEGDSAGLWNMPVGVNYKYEVANGAWTYAPTVTLGYRFAFGDDSVDETLGYNGVGSTFGTEIAEDSFFTRIGFEAKKDNIGFGVHYGYERGSDTEANQWGINCSFFF